MSNIFLMGLFFYVMIYCTFWVYGSSEPRIVLSRAQCGRYEYFNSCGSKCAPACHQARTNCEKCTEGCFCKKPYLRSSYGAPCVRHCPRKHGSVAKRMIQKHIPLKSLIFSNWVYPLHSSHKHPIFSFI